jgi:hypothetical protein
MVIRAHQMNVFQAVGDKPFYKNAAAFLRSEYPALTDELTDTVLNEMVINGVARARSHGFQWQSSLVRFVELMLAIAPNFDEVSTIRERLKDTSGSEADRVASLFDRTTFSEWQEAARDYDPGAWRVNVNAHPILLELRGDFPT